MPKLASIECSGCKLCGLICPHGAIVFHADNYGFEYPIVDAGQCVNCGLCERNCPALNPTRKHCSATVFAARASDEAILSKSSSGAIAALLATKAIENGWIVYGAAFDSGNRCVFSRCAQYSDLEALRGSKYVSSDLGAALSRLSDDLEQGYTCLFFGLPCQVAAVKRLEKGARTRLITVDIVCHGAPSAELFQIYIESIEDACDRRVKGLKFRDKKNGWDLLGSVRLEDKLGNHKEYTIDSDYDPYYQAFLNGMSYRESCYICKYANVGRIGDITLGDYWGIKDMHPEFDSSMGASLVMVNTSSGMTLFDSLDNIVRLPSTMKNAVACNPNLRHPTSRPDNRDSYLSGAMTTGFDMSYLQGRVGLSMRFRKQKRKIKKEIAAAIRTVAPSILRIVRLHKGEQYE